jgi:3-methyl-2-oxobutanoate hydroxymethyltransferase
MPFLAHRGHLEKAIDAALCLIRAGAMAIKIEGADPYTLSIIQELVAAGVPVMGHLGLLPQTILTMGEYKYQGKDAPSAKKITEDAQKLQDSGCCALVLECIPATLAKDMTQNLTIPTIGIGAGKHTDGQVLVWHDLLGFNLNHVPSFVKQYTQVSSDVIKALNEYHYEVQRG